MQIGQLFVGQQPAPLPRASTPRTYSSIDDAAVIAELTRRIGNVEKGMRYAVQGDRVLSQIAICPEAILIQSDKVAVVGEVTFADWLRDISGDPTGNIDPSITQIRGGVIRTGKVISKDGQSYLDLDATDNDAFLKCRSSSRINADGTFEFGGVGGKSLKWNGTDLTIGANSLIAGKAVSDVLDDIDTALSRPIGDSTASVLANSSADIVMSNNVSYLLRSKNTLAGLFLGSGGLLGRDGSGNTTFSIDGATGAAYFTGSVFSKSYVFAEGNTATGYSVIAAGQNQNVTSAMYGVNPSTTSPGKWITGSMGRAVLADNAIGVLGEADQLRANTYGLVGLGATGVYGEGSTAGSFKGQAVGVVASGNIGAKVSSMLGVNGLALEITGRMSITSTTKVSNLNASFLDDATKWDLLSLANAIGQGAFAFSTNDGGSWTNILLKKV